MSAVAGSSLNRPPQSDHEASHANDPWMNTADKSDRVSRIAIAEQGASDSQVSRRVVRVKRKREPEIAARDAASTPTFQLEQSSPASIHSATPLSSPPDIQDLGIGLLSEPFGVFCPARDEEQSLKHQKKTIGQPQETASSIPQGTNEEEEPLFSPFKAFPYSSERAMGSGQPGERTVVLEEEVAADAPTDRPSSKPKIRVAIPERSSDLRDAGSDATLIQPMPYHNGNEPNVSSLRQAEQFVRHKKVHTLIFGSPVADPKFIKEQRIKPDKDGVITVPSRSGKGKRYWGAHPVKGAKDGIYRLFPMYETDNPKAPQMIPLTGKDAARLVVTHNPKKGTFKKHVLKAVQLSDT